MTRAINISSTTYHHYQQFNIPNKKKFVRSLLKNIIVVSAALIIT